MNARSASISVIGLCLLACFTSRSFSADKSTKDEPKVTYDDHVRPILRQYCFTCHNQNQAKGGLAVDSYAKLIEGGSSGEVVFEDDLDSSRLWALINHDEEPNMPPKQDKLPADKLALVRKWIEGGLLENSGSKASTKKAAVSLAIQTTSGRPKGPVVMPEGLSTEPIIYTPRAAAVTAIATSPWAPLAAIAGQQQICLYNTDSGQLLGILPFIDGIPYRLHFSRTGTLLLAAGGHGGATGWTALYDVKTGKQLARVGDELDAILTADLSPDQTRIALGDSSRIVRILSAETGELLHQIRKHTDWIYAVRFSPDGVLLASGDRTNGLFIWEADTAREYLNLRGHTAGITDVAWRPDSNVLASASLDGTVRLWELNDGKQIKRWNAHAGGVLSIAYAQDGKLVTSGRDNRAKLWDGNGKLLKTFPALAEQVMRVAITHDSKRVIAGDWTGTVHMWNVDDGNEVTQLPPNPPTLAMRIEQLQGELKTARQTAATAASKHDSLQKEVAARKKQLEEARKAKKKNGTQLDKAWQTAKKQLATDQAALTNAQKTVAAIQARLTGLVTERDRSKAATAPK